MEIKTRTDVSPFVVDGPDGRKLVSEFDITNCNDWRDTPVGPVNFGWSRLGPQRYFMEYPDGRREPTTPGAFIASAVLVKPKRRSLLSWLFGD